MSWAAGGTRAPPLRVIGAESVRWAYATEVWRAVSRDASTCPRCITCNVAPSRPFPPNAAPFLQMPRSSAYHFGSSPEPDLDFPVCASPGPLRPSMMALLSLPGRPTHSAAPTDHQPTTNRPPTEHRPITDRAPTEHRPTQGPAPARWATGMVSVGQSPSQPVPSPRLREGPCPAPPPRPRPSPLGHWRGFGLAKSVTARPLSPASRRALPGFRERPWPVSSLSRKALAAVVKGP